MDRRQAARLHSCGVPRWWAGPACAALLLIVAIVLAAGAQAAEPPLPLRISPGNAARAQPLYAEKTGIFRRLGLAAEVTTGLIGEDTMRAMEAGTFDIGYANIVSIAVAADRGRPYVILALGSVYTSKTAFTVLAQAATSNLRSGKDLEGKTVATPTANDLGQLGVRAWVDKHGGNSSKVTFVHGIPLSDVPAALAQHRVDASETTEPQWTAQRKAGTVKLLARNFDAIAPRFVNGAFIARREWVETHREAARRFAEAMRQTARWARTHQAEATALFAAEMKVPTSVVAARARAAFGEDLAPGLVQPVLEVAARYGMIAPMRAEDLFFKP